MPKNEKSDQAQENKNIHEGVEFMDFLEEEDIETEEPYFVDAPKEIHIISDEDTAKAAFPEVQKKQE